jgi:hypothetical protein
MIFKHFMDYNGKFFWSAWEEMKDEFLSLWTIANFGRNKIGFVVESEEGRIGGDVETAKGETEGSAKTLKARIDGKNVKTIEKHGDSYLAGIFISTPALNDKLEGLVIKEKSKGGAGCSNKGKYPDVPEEYFCGPEGGACQGTYPVNTRGRWRAAKAYAHNAPNPQGIKDCADRIATREGWKK